MDSSKNSSIEKFLLRGRSTPMTARLPAIAEREVVRGRFKDRELAVLLKPAQWTPVKQTGHYLFDGWHGQFRRNCTLVSTGDLARVNQQGNTILLIDGCPHKVIASQDVAPGQIYLPTFCCHKRGGARRVTLSYEPMEQRVIDNATITIIRYYTGRCLKGCVLEIPEDNMVESIKRCLKGVPIVPGENYYCDVLAKKFHKNSISEPVLLNLVFVIEHLSDQAEDEIKSACYLIGEQSGLQFQSDCSDLTVREKLGAKEAFFRCGGDPVLNGFNFAFISHSSYEKLNLQHHTKPLLRVKGYLFCLSAAGPGSVPGGSVMFNESVYAAIKHSSSNVENYSCHVVDPVLPQANSVHVQLCWFDGPNLRTSYGGRAETGAGALLVQPELIEAVRTEMDNVPLQQGKVFHVVVPYGPSCLIMEATIVAVRGADNPSKENRADEQRVMAGQGFWVSPETRIALTCSSNMYVPGESAEVKLQDIVNHLCHKGRVLKTEAERLATDIILPAIDYQVGHSESLVNRGIILHGEPGAGKKQLALIIADITQMNPANLTVIEGSDLLKCYQENPEKCIEGLFATAYEDYQVFGKRAPLHIVVIDEIEHLLDKKDNNQIIDQFTSCLDDIEENSNHNILFIGTTNQLAVLDSVIKQQGRKLCSHFLVGCSGEQSRVQSPLATGLPKPEVDDSQSEDSKAKASGKGSVPGTPKRLPTTVQAESRVIDIAQYINRSTGTQDKKQVVSLKLAEWPPVGKSSGGRHFDNWHPMFRENCILVSREDLDKVDRQENTALLVDGTPYKVLASKDVAPGKIYLPPFFCAKGQVGNGVKLSCIPIESLDIKDATVKVVRYQTGIPIQECTMEISDENMMKGVKNSLTDVPIIPGERYYCSVPGVIFDKFSISESVLVNLIFVVEYSESTAKDKKQTQYLISDKSRLHCQSDIAELKIDQVPAIKEEAEIRCQGDVFVNGSNLVGIKNSLYKKFNLENDVKPLLKVNGYLFCVSLASGDMFGADAKFNQSALRVLKKPGGSGCYTGYFINPELPKAASVSVKLEWFKKSDGRNREMEKPTQDQLPTRAELNELVRRTMGHVPLQEGRIFQVKIPLGDHYQSILEATVENVAGIGDKAEPSKGYHPGGAQRPAFWVATETEIKLTVAKDIPLDQQSDKVSMHSIIEGICKEVGGVRRHAERIIKEIILPMLMYQKGYVESLSNRGMILYGPTGTGKTSLARVVADVLQVKPDNITFVKGPELVGCYIGQSESAIRELFEKASKDFKAHGREAPLHLVVIDEMETLVGVRGIPVGASQHDNRVTAQFLSCLDGAEAINNILVVGTTNRLDMIDDAIKRPGRLGSHFEIGLPDERGRIEILKVHCGKSKAQIELSDQDYLVIARKTAGKAGSFLKKLVRSAETCAMTRGIATDSVTMDVLSSLSPGQSRVTLATMLEALTEESTQSNVEVVLNGCLPGSDQFYPLESQGYKPETASSTHSQAMAIQKYIGRVAGSKNGATGTILITGRGGTGKTHVARQWIKNGSFNHLGVANAGELAVKGPEQVWQSIKALFEACRSKQRAVVVLDNIDPLLGCAVNLFQPWIEERAAVKDRSCVVIMTAKQSADEVLSASGLTFNHVLHLDALSHGDMVTILKGMNAAQDDIKRVVELFSAGAKMAVGDFLGLIKPCYSTEQDGTVVWNLDDLEADIKAFQDSRGSQYQELYS